MGDIIVKILKKIKKDKKDFRAYEDCYFLLLDYIHEDKEKAVKYGKELESRLEKIIPSIDESNIGKFYFLHRKVLLLLAPYDFNSFLIYIEWERKPEAKFYLPRRKALQVVVDGLQDLADDKLDLLAISMPPGVGKTTMAIMYLCWQAGRIPNKPILTGSHSNSFVRQVYDECLRIFDKNGEYLWREVFPDIQISGTNAKDCRIDLDKRQRFETLQFTSIGSGNAGLYRASTLLYCDDLVSGSEVALSKDRLDKLWQNYTTDLRQRKIGDDCKELHIATRWSVHDVIGRLEQEYEGSDRARFIVLPAMNEKDESNFDYKYGVGFSTKFYREQREIMDELDWKALYMNEPIERLGRLYDGEELRRYFELPDSEPDAIIAVCDTKDKGKDYAVLPVGYVYGNDYYIDDVLCNNGLPDVVDPLIVDILERNKVQMARFESNSAGGRVAKDVQKTLKEKGLGTHITTKYTTENKETKIIVNSSWVKEHCLFKDESIYAKGSEYDRFMKFLTSYTTMGKNKYDDCPDAMAMFSVFAQSLNQAKVEIISRPW